MSVAIGLPTPRSAASNSLFRPGGDAYTILPDPAFDVLEGLIPKPVRKAIMNALPRVLRFLVKLAQAGELDERVIDQRIAQAAGISERMVQYVLWALDVVLGTIGLPIINRKHAHGRRTIEFVRGFVARGSTSAAIPEATSPPAPPNKTSETTTTRASSSSLNSGEEKPPEPREVPPPGMVERACKLIPDATPIKVADVVAVYGAELVSRALDAAEKRPRKKDGNLKVQGWGYILNALKSMQREQDESGPAPQDPGPATPPVKEKTEPAEAAKEATPYQLTADELADLLAKCRSGNQANFARVRLRAALAEGGIPAELVATIPAELVEPAKPRAP